MTAALTSQADHCTVSPQANDEAVAQTLASLEADGYAVLPFTIPSELIAQARADLRGAYRYDHKDYNLNNRVENAWKFSAAVHRIATDERMLAFLRRWFDAPAFAFQTLNFERGSAQRLHSDFYHFASSAFDKMVGIWVALETVHPDSGPLEVRPGSHRLPYLFPEDIGCPPGDRKEPYRHYNKYEEHIATLVEQYRFPRELICLKEGQALVWHSNLLHGGSPIKDSARTRLSQVTHYFCRGHYYFSPITSRRNPLRRSIRAPYDVATGHRVLPFL